MSGSKVVLGATTPDMKTSPRHHGAQSLERGRGDAHTSKIILDTVIAVREGTWSDVRGTGRAVLDKMARETLSAALTLELRNEP